MKQAYYFSHDSNARNDTKILSMLCDYGMTGYGRFWVIIESLREQEDFRLKHDKSTWRALAMQMHCTVEEVKKYIEDCIYEFALFELTEDMYFFSNSLMKRMDKYLDIKEKRTEAANKRWSNTNGMHLHTNSNANDEQNDANKSKLNKKESKVNIKENIYSPVIDYLNSKCNTNYKHSTGKTKSLIDARVNEGFKQEDFEKVIDIKSKEWLNTDLAKYLRPETLFGNKFESYLNQEIKIIQKKVADW